MLKGHGWLSQFKQRMMYGFIILIIIITIALFGIITYTSDSAKENSRRVFESALWNTLQLQVQTYRLLNYLVLLKAPDLPLNGQAYFEYDLLMSRIDLLRDGEVGTLVREFEGGRTTRLLNIMNGELELLSFHISKLEEDDLSYLPSLIDRIQKLDPQLNEFVGLVNNGSNAFINRQHQIQQTKLHYIQLLSIALLACLLCLCFFMAKSFSQLRFAHARNKQLKADMQNSRSDKADLLGFINQQVRPPINAILGTAKTLNQSSHSVPEPLTKHIEESGQQLLHTIEMLSDLSLLEAQKLSLQPSTNELKTQMEVFLELTEAQMSRKNLACALYIDSALPDSVHLDFGRFKEIVLALLQNAIAHCPAGSISIQLRPSALAAPTVLLPDGTYETRVMQLAIRDTGLGMPLNLQQSLRVNPNLPNQADSPDANTVGLNLALCHQLIYLMKGEMHFSCVENEGCEFWVDLPFYVPAEQEHPTDIVPITKTSQPQKTALILEQDMNLAKIIELQLTSFNIKVSLVQEEDGHSPLDQFDLILLGQFSGFDSHLEERLLDCLKAGTTLWSYQTAEFKNSSLDCKALTFPLTQRKLLPLIEALFLGQTKQKDNK
ncbi:sensor histidine kinase [Marinomonas posidonica]|uniref:histidine kinase n=1 Tax=Marinomonas posidonica (strain CECT 7376 / NCIMB 14433 / IVIA-Po-181) TaxID=491952 RepID=F6CVN3_MARPP|nr:HAMP domain-containing sensor histidine kinase [Marinomonas posidonica]AEF56507.1 integral membrane sensor signal transduction histidine kinase [Marinomonas posidonica IVIA-Po-181]